MKTLEEQIKEVLKRLDNLENNLTERSEFEPCCYECDCGCSEPELEINDDTGPDFDGAGFSIADREPDPQPVKERVFTEEELVRIVATLMERTLEACKAAVSDATFDADRIVTLELGYGNQIDIEIDEDLIRDSVIEEINNTIELDTDSIRDEIELILSHLSNDEQS